MLSGDLLAQTKPKRTEIGGESPKSVLWVGNSFFYYNNSMHNYVARLVGAAVPKMEHRATSVTISGSGFDWHDMESYFRPNGIGKYSISGDNELRFNKFDKSGSTNSTSRSTLSSCRTAASVPSICN